MIRSSQTNGHQLVYVSLRLVVSLASRQIRLFAAHRRIHLHLYDTETLHAG